MLNPERDHWPSVEDVETPDGCPYCEARDGEAHQDSCPLMVDDRNALIEVLFRVADYLDDKSDVEDGPDGQPQPNRAMCLLQDVEAVLAKMGRA